MHISSALVAGTLALQASAFLIPLEITKVVEEAKGQVESLWSQSTQTVELDCPNCPFFAPHDTSSSWDEDDENKLVLDFAIDHDESLRINGRDVFSIVKRQSFPGPLSASQIRTADSLKTDPVQLGWALEVLPPVTNRAEPEKELYTLQFTVLDLKGVPVEVDSLKIDILKHTILKDKPTLSLLKISPVSFLSTPGAKSCHNASQWSLCRLRAIIATRIKSMLESAKAQAGTAKAWVKGGCKGKKGPFGGHKSPFGGHRRPKGSHRPHGDGEGRPHHGHHGPHHHGHHFNILRQTLRFFIVPALLGVVGGLVASAVGMLVGQTIVFMWTRFHRNGQRGNIRIVEAVIEDDEKDALIIEELPPQYADVEAVILEDEKSI